MLEEREEEGKLMKAAERGQAAARAGKNGRVRGSAGSVAGQRRHGGGRKKQERREAFVMVRSTTVTVIFVSKHQPVEDGVQRALALLFLGVALTSWMMG